MEFFCYLFTWVRWLAWCITGRMRAPFLILFFCFGISFFGNQKWKPLLLNIYSLFLRFFIFEISFFGKQNEKPFVEPLIPDLLYCVFVFCSCTKCEVFTAYAVFTIVTGLRFCGSCGVPTRGPALVTCVVPGPTRRPALVTCVVTGLPVVKVTTSFLVGWMRLWFCWMWNSFVPASSRGPLHSSTHSLVVDHSPGFCGLGPNRRTLCFVVWI